MFKLRLIYIDYHDDYEFFQNPYHIAAEIANDTPELIGFTISGTPHKQPKKKKNGGWESLRDKINNRLDELGYESVLDVADYIRKHNPTLFLELWKSINENADKIENLTKIETASVHIGDIRYHLPRPPASELQKLIYHHSIRVAEEKD